MTTLDGTGSGPAVHVRNHETDCTARALSAGMMIRANIAPIAPNAPPGERPFVWTGEAKRCLMRGRIRFARPSPVGR